jgi:hypothetical protein
MAIFGLSPFEGFYTLLLGINQPFEDFHAFLLIRNGLDSFFESFTQVLIRFAGLLQFFVFALQQFAQGLILGLERFQFFILRHAATLADRSPFRNCIALLNSY